MTTLGHLILKFVLLVVLTFLFVVLFDNGPNDYVSALQSNLSVLLSSSNAR
ncbi:MAG: hypothetical protein WA771_10575 [Chthoniobacterales bacterium]